MKSVAWSHESISNQAPLKSRNDKVEIHKWFYHVFQNSLQSILMDWVISHKTRKLNMIHGKVKARWLEAIPIYCTILLSVILHNLFYGSLTDINKVEKKAWNRKSQKKFFWEDWLVVQYPKVSECIVCSSWCSKTRENEFETQVYISFYQGDWSYT